MSPLPAQGEVSFIARRDYLAPDGPHAVAVGDFNGDALPDLAVGGRLGNTVTILIGQSDGTFTPAPALRMDRITAALAVGDFNQDNHLDLVLAVGAIRADRLVLLLGNGDGTFQPPQTVMVGGGSSSVAVGDFNGDGRPDVAVSLVGTVCCPYANGNVQILLGQGDGTFELGPRVLVGRGPFSLTVGDFNQDTIPDLVMANFSSDDVSVLLGRGDGTFAAARRYPAGVQPSAVAVGDFDGDAIADLAVTSTLFDVSILIGNGDGTFRAGPRAGAGRWPASVAVGDFNGDGMADLAVSNGESYNISILLGRGDGSFAPAQNYPVGWRPWSVQVADFNGDDRADLVVANWYSRHVSILLGRGDGTFVSAPTFPTGRNPISIAAGDFNEDAILDLVTANQGSNTVSILLGEGNGTFQPARSFAAGRQPTSVAVGDFNGDGQQDLAVANWESDNVSILISNGDGTFQEAQHFAVGQGPVFVVIGDFNGDSIQDLAVANYGTPGQGNTVSILLGRGDGTFAMSQTVTVGRGPQSIAVGDFNGDAFQDLAVTNFYASPGTVSILLSQGDGTFTAAPDVAVEGVPRSVAVGDFDGDNRLDLATANLMSNDLSILINRTGSGKARVTTEP